MSGIFFISRIDEKRNPLRDSCSDYNADTAGKKNKNRQARCAYDSTVSCLRRIHAVHIPTDKDDDVKVYMRMRDDHKQDLKKTKQRICAFCLSQGFHYDKTKWTQMNLKWLKTIGHSEMDRETLNEYLITYEYQSNQIETFDKRIEELASEIEYVEKVKKPVCFLGVKTPYCIILSCRNRRFQKICERKYLFCLSGIGAGRRFKQ